jgi:hypothetical protein
LCEFWVQPLALIDTLAYHIDMVMSNVSVYVFGAACSLRVKFGRAWYSVEFPCGIEIKVNPRAKLDGMYVGHDHKAVARVAIQTIEAIEPNTKLGKLIQEHLEHGSQQQREWGQKHGYNVRPAWSGK